MKKRAIISTCVAFVLLIAVVAAGLNAVFTVTKVSPSFTTYTSAGESDARELEKKLSVFQGKSTTFLNLDDVRAVVAEYPCFSLETIDKQYPSTVTLSVCERKETYAFEGGNGYTVLDANGVCLYTGRTTAENSRTSGDNVVVRGFDITAESGGAAEGEYISGLLAFAAAFSDELADGEATVGIRSIVISVTLVRKTSVRADDYFDIVMREGVVLRIFDPDTLIEDKARAAAAYYRDMGDGERTYGGILVMEVNGEVKTAFFDELAD